MTMPGFNNQTYPAGGAPAFFFEDDATGTDATVVNTRTGWATGGDNPGKLTIQGNQFEYANVTGGHNTVTSATPTADQAASMDCFAPTVEPTGAGWYGPCVRADVTNAAFEGYCVRIDNFSETISVGQGQLNAAFTSDTFANVLSNQGIDLNGSFNVRIAVTGTGATTSIRVYVGAAGGAVASTLVSSLNYDAEPTYPSDAGEPSIMGLDGEVTVNFDNFRVEEI